MKLSELAKERVLSWLKESQSRGSFDGEPEETMDFDTLSDEDLAYYFTEWFFTEGVIEDLDEDDEIDMALLAERNRLVGRD